MGAYRIHPSILSVREVKTRLNRASGSSTSTRTESSSAPQGPRRGNYRNSYCGETLQGVWLGTATFLTWLGIAKAKQRASAPTWGWEQALMSQVLRSVALPGHLAVAWNEEMVFLDYGCEAVREALGQGKAVAVLIPGFALYDSRDP